MNVVESGNSFYNFSLHTTAPGYYSDLTSDCLRLNSASASSAVSVSASVSASAAALVLYLVHEFRR